MDLKADQLRSLNVVMPPAAKGGLAFAGSCVSWSACWGEKGVPDTAAMPASLAMKERAGRERS